MKDCVGYLLDGGCHCVLGVYGADYRGPALVAAVVLYSYRLDVGDYYEILPYLLCKARFVELVAENCISLAERFKSVAGDSTEATNAKTGAGEGLTVNHTVRKSKCLADNANLVLVKELYGLDKLKVEVLGKSANVVVRLDCLLALCLLDALEYIGVNRTLREEINALEAACLVGKYVYELCADNLSLLLGL